MREAADGENVGAAGKRERAELIGCQPAIIEPVHFNRETMAGQERFDTASG